MLEKCDVVVIFPIFGQFGAIQNAKSGRIFCKIYMFINSNLLSQRSLTHLSHYCFESRYYFCQKCRFFSKKKKDTDISKIKSALVLKLYFLKLHMYVYLRTKFQVSSIIQKSFRQWPGMRGGGCNFTPSTTTTSRARPKKPPQIRVKHLLCNHHLFFL